MNSFSITVPWWFTERVIREYLKHAVPLLRGRLLDVGCGKKPYRDMFDVDCYIGIDTNLCDLPDVVASAKNLPFRDESFEAVISNQVLEHIDDTETVLRETNRVLVKGGIFVFTAPFVARVHGAPHDYWRFSEHGIRYWLERQKFYVRSITPMGGFFTTQCYLWSFFIWERVDILRGKSLLHMLPKIFFALFNIVCWLIHKIEKKDKDTTTPFNYIGIGQK